MSAYILCTVTLGVSLAGDQASPPPLVQDGLGGYVIEDLVVVRRAGVDDVTLEKDGSFSLLSDDSSTVFSALNSGSGAAVNFDVAFAKHSVVMTADGQLTLETIARALRLIGAEQPFTILIKHNPKLDPSGRRGLTEGRAAAIIQNLTQRHGVQSAVAVKFGGRSSGLRDVGRSQLLQVTVINSGSESIAIQ